MKNYTFTLIFSIFLISACKEKTNKKEATVNKNNQTTVSQTTDDMVYFEGGTFTIGNDNGLPNEKPAHPVEINPFYLDKNLVTVNQFRQFILATGYKTEAEKFGDSGVFLFDESRWILMKGAYWEYPLGEEAEPAQGNHPVTQVSWNDAVAYANWAGKRLPTEYEWEYAAKNGQSEHPIYAWGAALKQKDKHQANTWTGQTVKDANKNDGFLFTSPVGHYGVMPSGLTDMGGNVWQWCSNDATAFPLNLVNAQTGEIKSTRGGSFMFDPALDLSFTVYFRGQNSADTSLFNTGFRCAK